MNLLIVAATTFEVKPLLDFLEIEKPVVGMNKAFKDLGTCDVHVLITGIGMVNTALMVGRHTLAHFDLVINAGVCGAFDKNRPLGQLVNVTEDILSEMGAEDGDEFITYDKLNLEGEHAFKNQYVIKNDLIDVLPKVKGITVNTIHGNEQSIEKIKLLYNPDVESMEGAAFFAATENSEKNYNQIFFENKPTSVSVPPSDNRIQIRAISNYVEKRDKSKWNMPLAINNLNEFLIEFVKTNR